MSKKQLYISMALAAVVVWILVTIRMNAVPYLDRLIAQYVENHVTPSIYTFALGITELGSRSFMMPFTIVVGLLLVWLFKDWVPGLFFAGGTLFSHLIGQLIKILVGRERPSILMEANAEGFSFPSGHSLTPVVCYGFLLFLLFIKIQSKSIRVVLQILFILLILSIGLSRIIINVHYLTDVIGGFAIGILFLISLRLMYKYVQTHRSKELPNRDR